MSLMSMFLKCCHIHLCRALFHQEAAAADMGELVFKGKDVMLEDSISQPVHPGKTFLLPDHLFRGMAMPDKLGDICAGAAQKLLMLAGVEGDIHAVLRFPDDDLALRLQIHPGNAKRGSQMLFASQRSRDFMQAADEQQGISASLLKRKIADVSYASPMRMVSDHASLAPKPLRKLHSVIMGI